MSTLRTSLTITIVFTIASIQRAPAEDAPSPFDELYDSVMIRKVGDQTHGSEAVAPLLWRNSRFLIQGDHHNKLVKALDRLSAAPDEEVDAIAPVKRALLQRHLWTVFDWTASVTQFDDAPGSVEDDSRAATLQSKISPLLKRLALSEDEISKLPDTFSATATSEAYAETVHPEKPFEPFFPRNLYDEKGPWVCLKKSYHSLPAKVHTEETNGRSAFHVFIRLPGDREATLGYLRELTEFQKHWVTERPKIDGRTTPNGGINYVDIYVNPDTPQFPAGTQVALVEQAMLIDDRGKLVASPLTVGIQLRAYLRLDLKVDRKRPVQAFAEFVMQPRRLMEGDAAMKAVGADEVLISTILSGGDQLHNGAHGHRIPRLQSCIICHSGWGVHSVNSRAQSFELRNLLPPRFLEGGPDDASSATIELKRKSYSWGLLEGLWRGQEP